MLCHGGGLLRCIVQGTEECKPARNNRRKGKPKTGYSELIDRTGSQKITGPAEVWPVRAPDKF